MNRRNFMAGLAGLPIVGLGARMFGLPKPTAKSVITVHGPELLAITTFHARPKRTLSLRFENVPLRGEWNDGMGVHVSEMHSRIRPLGGVVNRSDWHWYGGPESDCLNIERARTLMFTDWGMGQQKNGLCYLICGFTPAAPWKPWPGSHRPVDFETEILKALEGRGRDGRETEAA
jgi:hypothetical protein